ncbi:hypothetical protein V6Z11_D11G220700 [Gossypium hirsutum]
MVLHGVTYRCRCHVPDMVLRWHSSRAATMSQTWSYTDSPLSVPMPCPRHGLTLALLSLCRCHVPDMVLHWHTHCHGPTMVFSVNSSRVVVRMYLTLHFSRLILQSNFVLA